MASSCVMTCCSTLGGACPIACRGHRHQAGQQCARTVECGSRAEGQAGADAAVWPWQEFEPKGLGSFGGGAESREAWRRRVSAQDAYTGATEAKAAALAAREDALLAKREALARQEAAALEAAAQESEASAAAEAAQAALEELESREKVSSSK